MGFSLPPLTQLRSFIFIGSYGQLNRAADVLGLTESAVSHHLRKLEETLGVRLVKRGSGETALTKDGERFYIQVREALDLLNQAVEDLSGGHNVSKVVLTLPRPLATHWIIPRYSELYAKHTDLELQLLPTARCCNLEREQIDLGIRLGREVSRGLTSRPLVTERICPLTTPELAQKWRDRGWQAMLEQGRLILNKSHPLEWRNWSLANGFDLPDDMQFVELESFDLVLQAGLSGAGIIMGRTPMVDTAVIHGQLVAPFGQWFESGSIYYLVWPENRPPNRYVHMVIDWLLTFAEDAGSD